jgi:predicted dehydrogenase
LALAAIAAGKHRCTAEKRWRWMCRSQRRSVGSGEARGICNAIGFNYICNPMVQAARGMIQAGEIGEVVGFSGHYVEGLHVAIRARRVTWRCETQAGRRRERWPDLGSHLINRRTFCWVPFPASTAWSARCTRNAPKPPTGKVRTVENEDLANSSHSNSQSGVPAPCTSSRVAAGTSAA